MLEHNYMSVQVICLNRWNEFEMANRCLHSWQNVVDSSDKAKLCHSVMASRTKHRTLGKTNEYVIMSISNWKYMKTLFFKFIHRCVIRLRMFGKFRVAVRSTAPNHDASWCVINTKQFSFLMLLLSAIFTSPCIWHCLWIWCQFSLPVLRLVGYMLLLWCKICISIEMRR